jgi:hypothetical protein
MDAKSLLKGIDEYRRYLLGEIPLHVGDVDKAIADWPLTYFQAKLSPDDVIIKSLEETLAHPERLASAMFSFREEALRARSQRLAQVS